ncbi:MAG: hypothetical protein CME62_16225 [Halobacteriovoraceae bacterium]|nr:hypothetical protein [Halobacteriovoraceae bacterium]|tara:strand:+ start:5237 stop:5734 length:498 start_codon:yes stop_codon:yes gene_type:complete
MRYYIINSDGKEVSFDLSFDQAADGTDQVRVSNPSARFSDEYFVKNLGKKKFISKDKKSWRKLPEVHDKFNLVNGSENLKVYRGFKPSGLAGANAGELIAQMPGKVIKIMTTEGAVVNEGDTLIILEAMKMENEIKAGINGVVKSVNIKEGQVLESGHLMIEIEE